MFTGTAVSQMLGIGQWRNPQNIMLQSIIRMTKECARVMLPILFSANDHCFPLLMTSSKFSRCVFRAAVPALLWAIAPFTHAADGWLTNYEEAKALAAKENKDLLIDFTGSDWCAACAALQKEVWSKDVFKQEAPKHFVLLELDYPQEKPLSKELTAQNEKLQQQYDIKAFPTVLLADAKGRPYAMTGYDENLKSPEAYNEHLAELRKVKTARDEAMQRVETAQGADKAKALYEALKVMGTEVSTTYYKEELDQVIALDTGDTLGLKAKREYAAKRQELEARLEELMMNQKTKEYTEAVDAFIAAEKVTGKDLQDLLLTKLTVLGPADLDKVPALLDEVIKVDAASELADRARSIKLRVIEMRGQIEKSKNDPAAGGTGDPVVKEKEAQAPVPQK